MDEPRPANDRAGRRQPTAGSCLLPSALWRFLAVLGIVVALALYAEVLAHTPATGQDFRNFYAAAAVLRDGGNPYDLVQLLGREERLYRPTTAAQRGALAGNPYVQGPPLAMAFMSVVGLPPATVYRVYAAVLAAIAAAALALLARLWPLRRPVRRAFLLLISPVTFLGVLLGQADALLLLALVLALWWLDRERYVPAGLVLALGLIKPQIMGGPIVLLAVLAWRRGHLDRYVTGLLAGTVAFVGGSLLIAGPTVVSGWLGELAGFSGSTVFKQVDIASLSTLYVGWAPHALGLALSAATLLAWAGLCVTLWRTIAHSPAPRSPAATPPARSSTVADPPSQSEGGHEHERWWLAAGLVLWLLATPYAHPHDDVLLLPAVWYLWSASPYRGRARLLAIALCLAWWLLPMTSVLGLRPPLVRGLGVVPVLLLAALVLARRPSCTAAGAAATPLREAAA